MLYFNAFSRFIMVGETYPDLVTMKFLGKRPILCDHRKGKNEKESVERVWYTS